VDCTTGEVVGFTAAPLTISTQKMTGLHFAAASIVNAPFIGGQFGVANYVSGLTGLQAAVANFSGGESFGAQIGVLNIGGDITGAQVGVLNIASRVTGTQVGLLNISQSNDNPVGLLNIVRKGQVNFALWTNETSIINLALKLGGSHVYSILLGGVNPRGTKGEIHVSYGLGLGVRLAFGRWYGELEGTYETLYRLNSPIDEYLLSTGLHLNVGYHLFEKLSVFAGPQLQTLVGVSSTQLVRNLSPWGFDVAEQVRLVPGFVLGVQFL
jgi:hypothetical protein